VWLESEATTPLLFIVTKRPGRGLAQPLLLILAALRAARPRCFIGKPSALGPLHSLCARSQARRILQPCPIAPLSHARCMRNDRALATVSQADRHHARHVACRASAPPCIVPCHLSLATRLSVGCGTWSHASLIQQHAPLQYSF